MDIILAKSKKYQKIVKNQRNYKARHLKLPSFLTYKTCNILFIKNDFEWYFLAIAI